MKKILIPFLLLIFIIPDFKAQVVDNPYNNNRQLKGTEDYDDLFNNIDHPLAITGGILTLGGAITYIAGSSQTKFQPSTTTQFIGIGIFAAGATLFTIFSTERPEKVKRKKKKEVNPSDWQIIE